MIRGGVGSGGIVLSFCGFPSLPRVGHVAVDARHALWVRIVFLDPEESVVADGIAATAPRSAFHRLAVEH